MKPRTCLFLLLIVTALAGTSVAQQAKPRPVRFTSVYTSLNRGCKIFRGTNGTDDASLCKGVGGYKVRTYSAAVATYFIAVLSGGDDDNNRFTIATVSVSSNEPKGPVEWRLANGTPFAVMLRVPKFGPATDEDPYFGKLIGQEIVVRGLKGFSEIDLSVDAKTPDANGEARRLADAAYTTVK